MTYRFISKPLSAVCDIQLGYTARGRLEPLQADGVPSIQLRDLPDEGKAGLSGLTHYKLEGSLDRYRVRKGDVLFRSRGQRNTAVAIAPQTDETAIAISPLLILRPVPNVLDPHYLAWFINQPQTQRYFDSRARGTNMRMISKKCVAELDVAIPAMEAQKKIAEIAELAIRERALSLELAEKKLAFTNFALLAQVQDARPHGNGTGQ